MVGKVKMISMDADLPALRNVAEAMLALAKLLVDDSDAVRLEVIAKPTETLIRLHVAPEDMGKLIGKQGRTARSLRSLLGAIGMKHQRSFALDIVGFQEQDGSPRNEQASPSVVT